jgi:predicted nucleic acid-binding protein
MRRSESQPGKSSGQFRRRSIDTNVLLDFYRFSGGNASEMLQQLDAHKNEIILTRQVLMEFLKNRRSAIVAAFSQLSKPIVPALPLNLRGLVVSNAMITQLKDAEASYKEIERKIKAIIETPSENDDVFKLVTTVFSSRADDEGDELFEKASNRWQRGYPPRKDKDNSIGDALNWEAMLAVVGANPDSPNLIIVSRDGDFSDGPKGQVINEWLEWEFKEKFGDDRVVLLTQSLSEAIGYLGEAVSNQSATQESEVIDQNTLISSHSSLTIAEPLASLREQMEAITDPLAKYRGQIEALADPLAKYREQIKAIADPLAKYRDQMEAFADPLAKYKEQMEAMADPLAKLREQMDLIADPLAKFGDKL